MISQSVENFLKSVYELQTEDNWVQTTELARRLDQKPASTTSMIKKLAGSGKDLIEYIPYQGVRLKRGGELIALEVIRHHRLIELYLSEALGVPWDQVHEEAEKLEHVISEDLEERMSKALGDPSVDPHGQPIPDRDLVMPERASESLSGIAVGTTVQVVEVYDHDPELLRYLGELNLYPGTVFTVVATEEFGASLTIELDGCRHNIGERAVPHISVTPITPEVSSR